MVPSILDNLICILKGMDMVRIFGLMVRKDMKVIGVKVRDAEMEFHMN